MNPTVLTVSLSTTVFFVVARSPLAETIVTEISLSPEVIYSYCWIASHSIGVFPSQKSKMNFLISPFVDSD